MDAAPVPVPPDEPQAPPPPRPSFETLLGRAIRLRCPRCGVGKLFLGWFIMPERCEHCRLKYERAPGFFLGSTYVNYGLTALVLMASYFLLHFGVGWTNRQLAAPLAGFCILFPLWAFRYARAIWLALDCQFDSSVLSDESS